MVAFCFTKHEASIRDSIPSCSSPERQHVRNTTKQVSAGGSVIAGKLEKETAQGGGISE